MRNYTAGDSLYRNLVMWGQKRRSSGDHWNALLLKHGMVMATFSPEFSAVLTWKKLKKQPGFCG